MNNINFVQTTSILYVKHCQVCTNYVNFLFNARTLPNDEVNCLVRIEHILAMSLQVVDVECIACKFDQVS